MTVAHVFKDLTKVELVGILSDLVFDDELFARMTVASYRRQAAVEERAAISKRQSMALDRGDFKAYDQLERLRAAADERARAAAREYDMLARERTRQDEREQARSRPTLEPELEDTDAPPSTAAGRGLVAGERVVVDIAQAEFDDEPADALPHRPIGLPHKPARLGLRR